MLHKWYESLSRLSAVQLWLEAMLWLVGCAYLVSVLPVLEVIRGQALWSDSIYAGQGAWERFIKLFYHWDALKYLAIAREGHLSAPDLVPFFPLYPTMISWFSVLSLEANIIWSLVVSSLSFAAALVVWKKIFDKAGFAQGALCLAFFPSAVFFVSPYPESLFIALAGLCALCLLERRYFWLWPLLTAFLMTKHAAVPVTAGFMLWALLFRRHSKDLVIIWAIGLLSGVPILIYYTHYFGHPLAWLMAQGDWGRGFSMPWVFVANLYGKSVDLALYVVASFVAPVILFLRMLKAPSESKPLAALMFLMTAAILVPLWFGTSTQSLYRIVVLATPALLCLRGLSRRQGIFVMSVFLILNFLSIYKFVGGHHLP